MLFRTALPQLLVHRLIDREPGRVPCGHIRRADPRAMDERSVLRAQTLDVVKKAVRDNNQQRVSDVKRP